MSNVTTIQPTQPDPFEDEDEIMVKPAANTGEK
jgi:hypothetical protein